MCFLCVCSWALSCVCPAELKDYRVLPAAQPQQDGSALVSDHREDPIEDPLCGRSISQLLKSTKLRGKAEEIRAPKMLLEGRVEMSFQFL